jgi:hypothetical protein
MNLFTSDTTSTTAVAMKKMPAAGSSSTLPAHILASRLAERINKPTIDITDSLHSLVVDVVGTALAGGA